MAFARHCRRRHIAVEVIKKIHPNHLEAALDELSESGAVFGLVGEAGIGKSRLAAEVAAIAVGRGIPVLRTRGLHGRRWGGDGRRFL